MFKSLTAMGFHASQHVPLKLCPDHWVGNKTRTTHGSLGHRGTLPQGAEWLAVQCLSGVLYKQPYKIFIIKDEGELPKVAVFGFEK